MPQKSILMMPSLSGTTDIGGFIHQCEVIDGLSERFDVFLISQHGVHKIDSNASNYLPMLDDDNSRNAESVKLVALGIIKGLFSIKQKKINLIYARHGICTLPAILLSKISGRPVILEINGILSEEVRFSSKTNTINKLLAFLDKFGSKNASKLITVTENIKQYFVINYGKLSEDCEVIPNGANTELFSPKDKNECMEILKLEKEVSHVIFVGKLASWQGVNYLVEAAPIIIEEVPNAKILIVGDGEEMNSLISLAKKKRVFDRTIFTGMVPYDSVPLYINSSEVCVHPSGKNKRNEITGGSSLKIYEYLACGKPAVIGNLDGNKDLIRESNGGFVVSPENKMDLANAIIKLLKDKNLNEEMGRDGRNCVVKKYSWSAVSRKVGDVCEKLV